MITIKKLLTVISADTSGLDAGLRRADKGFDGASRGAEGMASRIAAAAAAVGRHFDGTAEAAESTGVRINNAGRHIDIASGRFVAMAGSAEAGSRRSVTALSHIIQAMSDTAGATERGSGRSALALTGLVTAHGNAARAAENNARSHGILDIALGNLVSRGIGNVLGIGGQFAGGVAQWGETALENVSAYERMGLSLRSLITRELVDQNTEYKKTIVGWSTAMVDANGKVVDGAKSTKDAAKAAETLETAQARLGVQQAQLAQLRAKAGGGVDANIADKAAKLAGLQASLASAEAKLANNKQGKSQSPAEFAAENAQLQARADSIRRTIAQVNAAVAEGGSAQKQMLAAQIAELQERIGDTQAIIANGGRATTSAAAAVQKAIPIYKTEIQENMSRAEAYALSAERAQDLQEWVTRLAILSPFEEKDVKRSLQMAMGYRFTESEARRLVTAMADMAAGAGLEGHQLDNISIALGQMRARGKISFQEMNQLMNANVSVTAILAKAYGKTGKEIQGMIEDGLIPAERAIDEVIKSFEKEFGGAAKEQAGTIAGLTSSLKDLKSTTDRFLWGPIFEEARKPLADIVELLQGKGTIAGLKIIGETIGSIVSIPLKLGAGALEPLKEFNRIFETTGGNWDKLDRVRYTLQRMLPPEWHSTVQNGVELLKRLRLGAEMIADPQLASIPIFDRIRNAAAYVFPGAAETIDSLYKRVRTFAEDWGSGKIDVHKLIKAAFDKGSGFVLDIGSKVIVKGIDFAGIIARGLAGDGIEGDKPAQMIVDSVKKLFQNLGAAGGRIEREILSSGIFKNVPKALAQLLEAAVNEVGAGETITFKSWDWGGKLDKPDAGTLDKLKDFGKTMGRQIAEGLGEGFSAQFKEKLIAGLPITDGAFDWSKLLGVDNFATPPKTPTRATAIREGLISGETMASVLGPAPDILGWLFPKKTAASPAQTQTIAVGEDIAAGVVTGLENKRDEVRDTAVKNVQAALEAVEKDNGIRSPSKVWHEKVGLQLMAGTSNGIFEGAPLVELAARGVFSSMTADVLDEVSKYSGYGRSLMTELAGGIKAGEGEVTAAIRNVLRNLAAEFLREFGVTLHRESRRYAN